MRVSLATATAILGIAVRRSLGRVCNLQLMPEDRTAAAAARSLAESPDIAIVDVELIDESAAAHEVVRAIQCRGRLTILLDPRFKGLPSGLSESPLIRVIRGRQSGELDLGVIDSELQEALRASKLLLAEEVSKLSITGEEASAPARTQCGGTAVPLYRGALDLIVIGVSTGGPPLLFQLLKALDQPSVPMLVAQHMPRGETAGFAARLAEICGQRVVETAAGEYPEAGVIGLLPGGADWRIVRTRAGLPRLHAAELPGNPFHPCIDEVLRSAITENLQTGAVILTGMGNDGAAGAVLLAQRGMPVIAQRPDTCAVAGMPKAVIERCAAQWVLPPEGIASALNAWFARAAFLQSPLGSARQTR